MELKLKDLIRKVQDELQESQQERVNNNQPALFLFNKLQIEASVTITSSTEKGGDVSIKVIQAGGKKSHREEEVHKISIELIRHPDTQTPKKKHGLDDSLSLDSIDLSGGYNEGNGPSGDAPSLGYA